MSNNQQGMMLNRLKAVLAEQGKTNRWLSEQLGKSENTVSRWCAGFSPRNQKYMQRFCEIWPDEERGCVNFDTPSFFS
jgi:hypothetical protein